MNKSFCLVFRAAKEAIFFLGFFAIFFHQATSDVYVDGTKGLKRPKSGNGVAYANFATHKFRHLNITPLVSASVKNIRECGKLCVDHPSCFSANFAEFFHEEGKIFCELLPSDKYNNSEKFLDSQVFHHLSIKTPCSKDPCKNGATCVPKYKDNDYHCACLQGYYGKDCEDKVLGVNCKDIKTRGDSRGDGMYWLDPDGGSRSNAFQAYCDMTSYDGGWTMCYTTDEYAKPKTEVEFNPQFSYGSDGYRTNCNNISFTEIIFVDHQTGKKVYFKRVTKAPITASSNYGRDAVTYGLWEGVGASKAYSYQLLICDVAHYSGFMVSGHTNCYKRCDHWCSENSSPYFRTSCSPGGRCGGVAFNTTGHMDLDNRLISVGLR